MDLIHQGGNYGWKIMEGNHCFSPSSGCDQTGLELPIVEYSHADGCSITGGYVYRGRGLPSLLGAYVYADFCSGKIWGLRYDGQAVTEHMLLVDSNLFITSLGTDLAGNLYLLSRNLGIYRLAPKELTGGLLATFEVAGEPFNVWVTSPDTIQQILALQQGTSAANIPVGPILEGPGLGDHNTPWNWHFDPEEVTMAELAIEVCDGLPSHVQGDLDYWINTLGSYCPWSATLIHVQDYQAGN